MSYRENLNELELDIMLPGWLAGISATSALREVFLLTLRVLLSWKGSLIETWFRHSMYKIIALFLSSSPTHKSREAWNCQLFFQYFF